MRLNEKLTNRTYDKASHFYMPPIGQVIVIENLDDEARHLAAIESHIALLTGEHLAPGPAIQIGPDHVQHSLYTR